MKEKPQKIMHIKDETWKIAEYSAKAKKHKWNTVDCDFLSFFQTPSPSSTYFHLKIFVEFFLCLRFSYLLTLTKI